MKRICVLLDWSINGDSRAQRTIRSMSAIANVDLFFIDRKGGDPVKAGIFNDRVSVYSMPLPRGYANTFLKHTRFCFVTSYFIDFVLQQKNTYDVIYAHDLPVAYPAYILAQKMKAKLLYDVHDLYVETINQQFPLSAAQPKKMIFSCLKHIMTQHGKRYEKKFLKKVDLLITTTTSYLEYLQEQYDIKKGLVVGNYPEYKEVPPSDRLYQELNLSKEKNIILYQGMLNKGRHLETIVNSAAYLNSNNVLVIVGDGPMKSHLEDLSASNKTTRQVFFLGRVNYEDLFPYTASASIGLMLLDPINISKQYALANKITEYMACGTPALVSNHKENKRVVGDTDSGYVIDVTSPEALGAYCNQILDDSDTLKRKGVNGKKAFKEQFNWNQEEQTFMKAFSELLETKK